jgi:hypothetical protein
MRQKRRVKRDQVEKLGRRSVVYVSPPESGGVPERSEGGVVCYFFAIDL